MKTYLICPVRNASPEILENMHKYVQKLEAQGQHVHFPPRDVDQNDPVGTTITSHHLAAMKMADRVDVFWDTSSNGSHFDLGMAFALDKPLRIVSLFPDTNIDDYYVKLMFAMQRGDFMDTNWDDKIKVKQEIVIGIPTDSNKLSLNQVVDPVDRVCLLDSLDKIDVYWDSKSRDDHFNMGMAYAMGKRAEVKHLYQPDGEGKSYAKVIMLMTGGDYAPEPDKIAFNDSTKTSLETGISVSA